nr:MAG TPA: hypothetical protein [Caudoviricetes sp.]
MPRRKEVFTKKSQAPARKAPDGSCSATATVVKEKRPYRGLRKVAYAVESTHGA